MKNSFINLLTPPDSILFQFEDSPIRFEEADGKEACRGEIDYTVDGGEGRITVFPSKRPIKRIKLRWRGDMSDVLLITGDDFERLYEFSHATWTGMIPHRNLPWYFQVFDGERLNCFGVKTGADSFCHFQCDEKGITLWLDLRCGGGGVMLKKPLHAATVVCRKGREDETPFEASRAFCKTMCDKPKLPKSPIFGVNNWYWAYGNISHKSVMEETDNLLDLCRDCCGKPYMIIDDGWQRNRYMTKSKESYNGGPWDLTSAGFSSMAETADAIHAKGAKAGIWFRPLLTSVQVPEEFETPFQKHPRGVTLDPSHPEVLELVRRDTERIKSWGYELIKHDFSTIDTVGNKNAEDGDWHFYDRSITNCTMLKNLYKTIEEASGDSDVIGCNTVGHISAGIHSAQRIAEDTSGRYFEYTRLNGCASYIRLPQNGTFFMTDPDCAAFTERVPIKENLDFLHLAAITGSMTLASAVPGILKGEELARAREIFKIASQGGLGAEPGDWLGKNITSNYETKDGKKYSYDWYSYYDGVRSFWTWYDE